LRYHFDSINVRPGPEPDNATPVDKKPQGEARTVRIVLADDHEIVRRGVRATLEDVPGWAVIAEASKGNEALDALRKHRPDVAIIGLGMPEVHGLDMTRRATGDGLPTRILVVAAHRSEHLVRDVLQAGALGYILKSDTARVLVTAVESALNGATFFTSNVAPLVVDGYLSAYSQARTNYVLSAREREIVRLLAGGSTNKEIARSLAISTKTAETHRRNIMRKMCFKSLSDLVRYAVRNQIVEL
jgi:DNA-binding NarL/FixJ family response regulator